MTMEAAESFELLRREIHEMASPWYTLKQGAAYLKTSETTVRHLINQGRLKAHYLAGQTRLHRKDLDAQMSKAKQPLQPTLPLEVPIPA